MAGVYNGGSGGQPVLSLYPVRRTETGLVAHLWLYYITDRKQFRGRPQEQRQRLLDKIAEAARCGVEFIQLREKDLSSPDLELLACEAAVVMKENLPDVANFSAETFPAKTTRLLISSRVDIAIAVGADGVHLPANDINAVEVRAIWNKSVSITGLPQTQPIIAVSCHSPEDVRRAATEGGDFAVFAPVFEKMIAPSEKRPGVGLTALCAATEQSSGGSAGQGRSKFPVVALGGVTLENAGLCLQSGAVGVAGIRLFQENDVRLIVDRLRNS